MSNLEYDSAVWDGAYLIQQLIYMPAAEKLRVFGTSVLDKIFEEYFLDDIIEKMRDALNLKEDDDEVDIGDFLLSKEGGYLFVTAIDDTKEYYLGVSETGDPQVWTFDEEFSIVYSDKDILTKLADTFNELGAYNE